MVQLEFNKSDQYLLGCTRDRQILMFKRGDNYQFTLHFKLKEAHTRIIWALSWSHDDALFATASRENKKSVKVWKGLENGELPKACTMHSELPHGQLPQATCLQFLPKLMNDAYTLVVGLETGELSIWSMNSSNPVSWQKLLDFSSYITHGLTVRRIRCGLVTRTPDDKEVFTVATCGNDHCVRIFTITSS